MDGSRIPVSRFQVCVVDKTTTGAIAAMPLWAGEGVGAVKRIQPAAQILQELVEEAEGPRGTVMAAS